MAESVYKIIELVGHQQGILGKGVRRGGKPGQQISPGSSGCRGGPA